MDGVDPFDGLTENDNFRTKMKAKRKYDKEMFEIEQLRRQAKLKFTTAASAKDSNKGDDADKAQSKKMKTTVEFLQASLKSYIDSLVRLKTEKDAREQKMSSHCCRVFANLCTLFVLIFWIPFTHNSQVEYHLSHKMRSTISKNFDAIYNTASFNDWTFDVVEGLFYPSFNNPQIEYIPPEENSAFILK